MAEKGEGEVVELQSPMIDSERGDSGKDMIAAGGASHTGEDEADMLRMGRSQQLKRNFHPIATLGLVTEIMTTWLGMIASSTFVLINGGRAGAMWLYLITWLFQVPVVGSMAEMASMAPTSAGQYHWVSEFAPPSMQNFLSYVSGWLSALGWQALIATTAYSAGQDILILASLNGTFDPKPWQGCLMTIAFVLLAAAFNIWLAKWLPLFEQVILFFNIVGFFAVCIPLWVLAPKAPSSEVWTQFNNGGDWASAGAATVIGLITTNGAFIGADSAAHMSEEVSNASLTVPRVMMYAVLLNGVQGFVATITLMYSVQNVDKEILKSTYAFPFIGVFAQATGSNAAAIGMTIPWAVIGVASSLNGVAAGSRQAWSFARDGGLPWSSRITKIYNIRGTPVPVNAILLSMTITIILAFIQIGSTEAFNSIVGLVGGAIGFSYTISIGCVLWRRLYGAPLPKGRWTLGRYGLFLNVAGVLFQLLATVISFFPINSSPTAASMNWSSLMFGAVALISSIYYVAYGRKAYRGPVTRIRKDD